MESAPTFALAVAEAGSDDAFPADDEAADLESAPVVVMAAFAVDASPFASLFP